MGNTTIARKNTPGHNHPAILCASRSRRLAMSVVEAAGLAAVIVFVALLVRYLVPTALQAIARRTGITPAVGWVAFLMATALLVLPVALGAPIGDSRGLESGEGWIIGASLAGLGVFLVTVSVTSLDEYRALRAATPLDATAGGPPAVRSAMGDLVALSSTPEIPPDADPASPLHGTPAVHADWLVQRREQFFTRRTWRVRAGGVHGVPFTLSADRPVAVAGAPYRALSVASTTSRFAPDEALPSAARTVVEAEADLPAPDEREEPVKLVEDLVPADEPVTVVGHLTRGPDGPTIARGPTDPLLGTHRAPGVEDDAVADGDATADDEAAADGGAADEAAADGATAPPVCLAGDLATARTALHRRVVWLFVIGLGLVVGGEALAFVLSPAAVPPLF